MQWLKPIVVAGMLVAGGAAGASSANSAAVAVNIPSQSLSDALNQLATQTGLQLIFNVEEVMPIEVMAPAVKGVLTPEAALQALLANTGLRYKFIDSRTVALSTEKDVALSTEKKDQDNHVVSGAGLGDFWNRLLVAQSDSSPSSSTYSSNQEATGGESGREAKRDTERLEEIIVSARRKEEKAQTVPIAITVVQQETLQANNMKSLGDLQYLIPSMSGYHQYSRDAVNVSIRGQGGTGGVVAYLNDVPIPGGYELAGGPGLLFDLENVQALKGPQGTLFGRNSVGGALLLQSARPTSEFGGHMQVGYGNYNNREFDGAINVPLVNEKLLTRFAVNGQVQDGFTRILAVPGHPNGIDANDRDYWSVRGTVSFRPNETFQNDTIVTYQKFTSHGSPHILSDYNPNPVFDFNGDGVLETRIIDLFPGLDQLFAQQQSLGVRKAIPLDVRIESSGSNLSVNNISRLALTDTLTLRNIVGLDVANNVLAHELDATTLPLAETPSRPRDTTTRQFTEEVQLLGKAFGGRLDWTAGAFWLDAKTPYAVATNTIFGNTASSKSRGTEKSKALFAQGTYDLSAVISGMKLTGGIRYTWDENFSEGGSTTADGVPTGPFTPSEAKQSALTWTAGLEYEVLPETLLYLTSRRGYRAGGPNAIDQVTGIRPPDFGPEFVTDYELGVKSDWKVADVPLRTNANVYYQDYSEIQVQQFTILDSQGHFAVVTANAAAARVWGVELEALVQPTRNLQLGANFDYLNFEYTHFDAGVQNSAGLTANVRFNRPPRKYGVNARYRLPLSEQVGEIAVRANWNWQDKSTSFAGTSADLLRPSGTIPAFGFLNLNVDWNGIAGKPLDASLFVSNVMDKTYVTGGQTYYNQIGFAVQDYGDPRMYGVRLRYNFGAR